MTLNQIVKRIQLIALSHQQVRKFYRGLVSDFLTESTTKYPAVFLQDSGGTISISKQATVLNFRIFFVDLVHVSEQTKDNETDVQSDMVSVAIDILAQMNNHNYNDWILSVDNSLQLVVEEQSDMVAGCYVDFNLRVMFKQNICAIPTDLTQYLPIDDIDMKLVYDTIYTATGNEGLSFSVPVVAGKKILFVTRENNPLFKVSNAPASSEFTWNDTIIGLGAITNPGERFLILYRNY